jgi:ABC-2 type transport system ATP-binding protein
LKPYEDPEMAAITIERLTKRYGGLSAVHELTLDVPEGEIVGFLGLNGAGKTTTIRILLDLLRPTSGTCTIFGHDCQTAGLLARAEIGYLPSEMGIYADLTGREVLHLLGGLDRRPADPKCRQILQERLEFPERDLGRRLREYSTGMKRKLGLIQALQSSPRLLILDEPTEGLDPLMQTAFYELLAEVKARGATVFMSSHVLSEVDRVCDRVALLRKGELVLLATVEETRKLAPRRVRLTFTQQVDHAGQIPSSVAIVKTESQAWDLQVNGELGPLLAAVSRLPVRDIFVEEPALEDVVVKYYREDQ